MRVLLIALLVGLLPLAFAQGKGKALEYTLGATTFEGYLVMPDTDAFPVPAVMIVHDWNGLDEYEKRRADMIADLGYAAFAVDVYGKGIRPKTPEESGALAGKYRNTPELRERLQAALDTVRAMPNIDKERIAAMGYCFGGGAALELARSGAPLAAAISFHGNLDTRMAASERSLRAKILVFHGAADPFVPMEQVQEFKKEMDAAKADWQLVMYGDAVHSFTEPGAGSDPSRGAAYNKAADERSWEHLQSFLAEVLLVRV